ncbi:MAG: hypothetical protein H6Q38_976 [Chloroflexi bacterium]|nr:hypothetical protein [Chloroflexota bacterium]
MNHDDDRMRLPSSWTTTTFTFVVHFWRERAADEVRWRGCVEHIQSGQRAAFLDIEAMLSFLKSFGIAEEDQHQPIREET